MDRELSIQQVAQRTGLSIHTLRYYERSGLLMPVHRLPNGHRRYSEADVQWIELLKCLRATAMPLTDIEHFTAIARQGESTSTLRDRRELLETHQQRIAIHLQGMQQCLHRLEGKIASLRARELEQGHDAEKGASGPEMPLQERGRW